MKLDLPLDQILPALDNIVRTRSPQPRSLFPRDEEIRKATEMLYLPHVRSGYEEPTEEEIHSLAFYFAAERYAYETFLERRVSRAVRRVVQKVENTKRRNKRR